MKIVEMHCTRCGSKHEFVNQELDVCMARVCERCHIKLTMDRTEGQIDGPAYPNRERVEQTKELAQKEADTARRLLVEAFGKE